MNEVVADLKKSLMEPQGHFVSLTPLSDHANTAMVTEAERAEINARAAEKTKKNESEKSEQLSRENVSVSSVTLHQWTYGSNSRTGHRSRQRT
jgi:hypothetical protein